MGSPEPHTRLIEVEEPFRDFAAAAITRLRYLFPSIEFSCLNSTIALRCNETLPETIEQEVAYALYREKIYSDTLSIRRSIYGKILGA